jgi:SMI1-KNR4 cell-wall
MRDLKEIGISYAGKIIKRDAPSAAEVEQLEQTLGVKLPKLYKEFLEQVNGFAPLLNSFSVGDYGWTLESFYHVASDLNHPYNAAAQSEYANEVLARPVIAIAGDGSGDQLIFDSTQDADALYMWAHDSSKEPIKVAATLEAFLDMLEAEA